MEKCTSGTPHRSCFEPEMKTGTKIWFILWRGDIASGKIITRSGYRQLAKKLQAQHPDDSYATECPEGYIPIECEDGECFFLLEEDIYLNQEDVKKVYSVLKVMRS